MKNGILYLSRTDVESLCPSRAQLREALRQGIIDTTAGKLKFVPKSTLVKAVGHSFQAMPALHASKADEGVASIKWVSVVPSKPGITVDNIQSVICLNDLKTGKLLSIMDGNFITLVRTAAISALASETLVGTEPKSIGFIGSGNQATEHLIAFKELFPTLTDALFYSRTIHSAKKLAQFAKTFDMNSSAVQHPDQVVDICDIIVSTVPSEPNLKPFLDARRMKPNSLAVMVDLGRSWLEEGFSAFDVIATDSLEQSQHPYDNNGNEIKGIKVDCDLSKLIRMAPIQTRRKAFFFKGIASADLVTARMVYDLAVKNNVGLSLPQ